MSEWMAEYLAGVGRMIREHGWIVQGVFPRADEPEDVNMIPFCYTIGLTSAGLPELLISWSADSATGRDLLNAAAQGHLGEEIVDGAVLTELANVSFRAVAVDAVKAEIQQAWNFYGDPYRRRPDKIKLVQLLWPDEQGKYPDEEGYDQERHPQQLWPRMN